MNRISVKEGTISVFAHYRHSGETSSEGVGEKKIFVTPFKSPHAIAGVSFRKKVYQGQYNSAEVGVNVSLPCYPEEIEDAIDEATKIASEHIGRLLKRFK